MTRRRDLLTALALATCATGAAKAQPRSRMVPVDAARRETVEVGAGTAAGATTGSSGPRKQGSRDAAAAGASSSTNPGASGGGAGSSGNSGGSGGSSPPARRGSP